jgi:hypothetical protein
MGLPAGSCRSGTGSAPQAIVSIVTLAKPLSVGDDDSVVRCVQIAVVQRQLHLEVRNVTTLSQRQVDAWHLTSSPHFASMTGTRQFSAGDGTGRIGERDMLRYALRLGALIIVGIGIVMSSQHVVASGPPGVEPGSTSGNVAGTGAGNSGTTSGVGVSVPTKSTVQVPQVLPNTGGGNTVDRMYAGSFLTVFTAIAMLFLGILLFVCSWSRRSGIA